MKIQVKVANGLSKENKQECPDIKDIGQETQPPEETPGNHPQDMNEKEGAKTQGQQDHTASQNGDQKECGMPDEPEQTQGELLQEKVDSLNNQLLRTVAEYDNFRKRSQREKETIYPQAVAQTVEKFIPIIDTVERALAVECSDAEFKKGIEMILQSFKDVLQKLGVEEFGKTGEQFDPEKHNAVMHVEDDQQEANTIVAVFQKGYQLGDKIIRHAMVQVAN